MSSNSWWGQTGPPWYIVILITSIAGIVIANMGCLLTYPIRRLRKDKYIGQWYEYHWTSYGQRKILSPAQLCVRHGVRSRYIVSANQLQPSTNSTDVCHGIVQMLSFWAEH